MFTIVSNYSSSSSSSVSTDLGVARCGRSAGCVMYVLWAMSAAVLGGGGYPMGVGISSSLVIVVVVVVVVVVVLVVLVVVAIGMQFCFRSDASFYPHALAASAST